MWPTGKAVVFGSAGRGFDSCMGIFFLVLSLIVLLFIYIAEILHQTVFNA